MPDSRFFKSAGPFTLRRIAEFGECELSGAADPERLYYDVGSLQDGTEKEVSFLLSRKYWHDFENSKVGACIIHPDLASQAPAGRTLLLSKEPYRSYGLVAQAFYPREKTQGVSIAPGAHVAVSAKLGEGTRVDAGAVIGENAVLGKDCHVYPNAVIGDNVVFGNDCIIGANASVLNTLAGNQVYIYPGARIGQDGFGFFMSPKGHTKIPQLGRVIIGHDVEIGANTCIDRGALGDTVIGDGSRLDNLIQFGHNVQTGRCCVVVSQVGIAGSTKLGDFVVLAGQTGVAGHLNIGSGVKAAAQSGITKDVAPGQELMGTPAQPMKEYLRQTATLRKMLKQLETKRD